MSYGQKITHVARSSVFKIDVVPVVACVAVAATFGLYKGIEHLHNPDVQLDRSTRGANSWEKDTAEQGDKWRSSVIQHYRHKDSDAGHLSIFEVFSADWWRQRKEVHADPTVFTKGGKMTVQ